MDSILAIYGPQSSFEDMEYVDAVQAIERNDFRDLRCHDIIPFPMSAGDLSAVLEALCLEDGELLESLRVEERAGGILLRVAPVNGDHVRLVDLANLLAEVDATIEAATRG